MSNKRTVKEPTLPRFGRNVLDQIIPPVEQNKSLEGNEKKIKITKDTSVGNHPNETSENPTLSISVKEILPPKKTKLPKVTLGIQMTITQKKKLSRLCEVFEITATDFLGSLIDKFYEENEKLVMKIYNNNQKI